jgi:hypothetical protein
VIDKLKKLSFKPTDLEAVLSSNSAIKQTLGSHLPENFRRSSPDLSSFKRLKPKYTAS